MQRRFFTLDVFTRRVFAGNPLAVVLDSGGLDDATMQTIAREFNLSETVFVAAPADAAHRADLRIFTPGRELPFAGHPTVGTAVLLAILDAAGQPGGRQFVLQEKVGPVPCDVMVTDQQLARAVFSLPKLPERLPDSFSVTEITGLFSLAGSDIGFEEHAPSLFSAGVPFPLVPLKSRAALDALSPPVLQAMERVLGSPAGGHVFLYCRAAADGPHHFHARMFAPGMGVAEDPATGSAVAAFAGAIMAFDRPGDGRHRYVVAQGFAMGRPSEIELTLVVRGGALAQAFIGGEAVIVSEGRISA